MSDHHEDEENHHEEDEDVQETVAGEEEEEEDEGAPSSKRSKHSSYGKMIDDIAEDEDDPDALSADEEEEEREEEAEEGEAEGEGEGEEEGEAEEPARYADYDEMAHLALNRKREAEEDLSLEERVAQQYGEGDIDEDVDFDYDDGYMEDQSKRPMPSIKDPKLWLVKCDPGKEEQMVLALMQKYIFKESSPTEKMWITSCFTTPASKGYVYIEAAKEVHVKRAIQGLQALKWWKVKLLPISEMVSSVKFNEVDVKIRPKQWVRMKRGIFAGDLAKVVKTADQNTLITVKMLPRIDFAALEEANKPSQVKKRKRSTFANRPPQKLFDRSEISRLGGTVLSKSTPSGSFSIFGANRFRHGFMYKEVKVHNLLLENVSPTAVEKEKFLQKLPNDEDEESEEEEEDEDDEVYEKPPAFVVGDRVIVTGGAMQNITGRIVFMGKSVATVEPDRGQVIPMNIDIGLDGLKKFFRLGDHVKVIRGPFIGETGMITQVGERDNPNDETLIIFSDVSLREIRTTSGDVVESSEISSGREELGNYRLFNLVQLNNDTVGVIVNVEISSFKVLTNRGTLQTVRLQEISMARQSKFATALDANGNQLTRDDVVNVQFGPHQGKQGTIKHIFRSSLFLYSHLFKDNNGMFLAQSRHCTLAGQTLLLNKDGAPHPALGSVSSSVGASGKARLGEKDPLLGKNVTVTSGPYKSFMGVVFDANGDELKVELHAINKKIAIPRGSVVDRSAAQRLRTTAALAEPESLGSETPLIGGRTPAYSAFGGQTPAYGAFGGQTPAYGAFGGQTPAYDPETGADVWSAQTPHHADFGEDSEQEEGVQLVEKEEKREERQLEDRKEIKLEEPSVKMEEEVEAAEPVELLEEEEEEKEPQEDEKQPKEEQLMEYVIGCRVRLPAKSSGGNELKGTLMNILKSGIFKVHLDGEAKSNLKSYQPTDVLGPVVPEKGSSFIVLLGSSTGQIGSVVGIDQNDAVVMIKTDVTMLPLNFLCEFKKTK